MSAGWVAAAIRSRSMAGHGVGRAGARVLADGSWADLEQGLLRSSYGTGLVLPITCPEARRHCSALVVWNLRVLAGWVPSTSLDSLRALVGRFEIENVETHLRRLASGSAPAPLDLGGLAVAWPAVRSCSTPDDVRAALRASSWGDPGGADQVSVSVGLGISWARRVVRSVPGATAWGRGAAALGVARERLVFDRELSKAAARDVDRLLGRSWRKASSLGALVEVVGPEAAWVFADVSDPADLWRGERAWWARVEADAATMLDAPRPTRSVVVGAVATMLVDLHRVHGAIETAGRGPALVEVFDAVA